MVTADILEAFVLRPSVRGVVGGCSGAAWALLVLSSCSIAADWPTFRGAERTGVAPDSGLLATWPATGMA